MESCAKLPHARSSQTSVHKCVMMHNPMHQPHDHPSTSTCEALSRKDGSCRRRRTGRSHDFLSSFSGRLLSQKIFLNPPHTAACDAASGTGPVYSVCRVSMNEWRASRRTSVVALQALLQASANPSTNLGVQVPLATPAANREVAQSRSFSHDAQRFERKVTQKSLETQVLKLPT